MPQFKNAREKRKYYKKREKQIKAEQKKIDAEVDKEYNEKYPRDHSNISNKLAKKMAEFFDILWPDDEEALDKEYEQYMSEEEKKQVKYMEREERRVIATAGVIFTATIIFGIAIFYTYLYFTKSHYEKVISPMIKEYFKNHYDSEIQTDTNNFICYEVKVEGTYSTKEECTNLLITTTDTKKHVLTIGDEYKGDDVNQMSFRKSFQNDFENQFSDIGIVYDESSLSYKDFYHDFNDYLDYINILPINMTYQELIDTGKVTITTKVLYQGNYDLNRVRYFLKDFSEDSRIYLIKVNQGLPSKLTIIGNEFFFEANVSHDLKLNNDVYFYELDRSVNSTSSCELIDVSTHGISESYSNRRYQSKLEYEFKNGNYFNMEYERAGYKEVQKPHYYLVKYSNNKFINNFILFDGSNGNYTELDKEKYPLFITMTLGSETYVITDDSFGIALKTEKKESIWCNFGLC